jgi:hypothetical protein
VADKPYPVDWRFLPEPVLYAKDRARSAFNRLGGGPLSANFFSKVWFNLLRPGTLAALRQAGVIFIHIPRTGGTSIARALYGRNLPHVSLAFYRSLGKADIAALPSFAIVRSPADRIASSYRFLRAGGTSLIPSSRYDPLKLAKCGSLEAFLEALARRPDLIREYDALRPQNEYVSDAAGRVIVDRLFPFEEIASVNQALSDWLGIAEIPQMNESRGEPVVISTDARHLVEQLYGADVKLHEDVCSGYRSVGGTFEIVGESPARRAAAAA